MVFPDGFFDRTDPSPDPVFYSFDRFVTHIDQGAIEAVGQLYRDLGVDGSVLDLCSSWISHFEPPPQRLVALGMNAAELSANQAATEWLVHDLNVDPRLPFEDASFDDVTCCVSVDYLVHPIDVFCEAARVLRPGGRFVVTFSNRCFATKAIRGWLANDDHGRCAIVARYFTEAQEFGEPVIEHRNPSAPGDPLYAVWAPVSAR